MPHLLDNIAWHTLTGPHAKFAAGHQDVRRYGRGFSPILGFEDPPRPNFEALAAFCEAGEHFYCMDWRGAVPAGWRIEVESTLVQMVWEAGVPDATDTSQDLPLGAAHVEQAVALATLTRPGPFGPRTIELGDYIGRFDGPRLMAMAGERMHAGSFHEISGVCTHPDHQGRGLARQLMLALIRRQMLRGETPFLHVMSHNAGARRLYERMGFRDRRETTVRVVSPDF
jgi:GNAT superfamily N-acetyltransferase